MYTVLSLTDFFHLEMKTSFTVSPTHDEVHAVTYFQFHGTTFHLVLVLFVSLHQKYGIPYLPTFCSLKHSLHLDVT